MRCFLRVIYCNSSRSTPGNAPFFFSFQQSTLPRAPWSLWRNVMKRLFDGVCAQLNENDPAGTTARWSPTALRLLLMLTNTNESSEDRPLIKFQNTLLLQLLQPNLLNQNNCPTRPTKNIAPRATMFYSHKRTHAHTL